MPLILTWRNATPLPVDGQGLQPESCRDRSPAELARMTVRVGNRPESLGDLFQIDGYGSDGRLVLVGEMPSLRRVGARMASGRLTIEGRVGPLLGVGLSGGLIEVEGSVGDWAGAELRGGLLRIRGRASDYLGSALPGSRLGMREGLILVEGSIGSWAGQAMRRGLIAVSGSAGDDLGHGLIAGTIVVFGGVGRRAGSAMKRGSLLLAGPEAPVLPPGFRFACTHRPPWLNLYFRRLETLGFPLLSEAATTGYRRYNGDVIEGGHGEILVPDRPC